MSVFKVWFKGNFDFPNKNTDSVDLYISMKPLKISIVTDLSGKHVKHLMNVSYHRVPQ